MIARVAIVCVLACAMLYQTDGLATSPEPVFKFDQLLPFARDHLRSRQCFPDDFGSGTTITGLSLESLCAAKVKGGGLAAECDGAPILALFFNCFVTSTGQLDANATSFDIAPLENFILSVSDDVDWKNTQAELMASCKRTSSAKLTPQLKGVYIYMCLRWSVYSECDRQQEDNGTLDAEGTLRRARFLSGDCPLSPSTLLDTFGDVTGRTWQECSQGLYKGVNITMLYASEVSRIVCLLQDFSNGNCNAAGNVDFPMLVNAIKNGDADYASTDLLLKLIDDCATIGKRKKTGHAMYKEMTTEEFVKCWASKGVFGCAPQEANQVASSFPETCAISVELN